MAEGWKIDLLAAFNVLNWKNGKTIQKASKHLLRNCRSFSSEAVEVWFEEFKRSSSKTQLCLLYVANDVVGEEKKKNESLFYDKFSQVLGASLYRYSQSNAPRSDAERVQKMIYKTWENFNFFDQEKLRFFRACYEGNDAMTKSMVDQNLDTYESLVEKSRPKSNSHGKEDNHEQPEIPIEPKGKTLQDIESLLEPGWEGITTFERLQDLVRYYLPSNQPFENVELNAETKRLCQLLNTAAEHDIKDDFVATKVKKMKEDMKKIMSNQNESSKEQETSKSDLKDDDPEGLTFSYKITEEKVELNLDTFKSLLSDYQNRLTEGGVRQGSLMEKVESLYEETSSEAELVKQEQQDLQEQEKQLRELKSRINEVIARRESKAKAAARAESILATIQKNLNSSTTNF